jgi:hypothetical protein
MNPLNEYPKVRKALYVVQWIISLVMGALGIVLAAQNGGPENLPGWYNTATLVLAFVWTYTGITAQGNVETVDYNVDPDGEGDEDDELPLQPLF